MGAVVQVGLAVVVVAGAGAGAVVLSGTQKEQSVDQEEEAVDDYLKTSWMIRYGEVDWERRWWVSDLWK